MWPKVLSVESGCNLHVFSPSTIDEDEVSEDVLRNKQILLLYQNLHIHIYVLQSEKIQDYRNF